MQIQSRRLTQQRSDAHPESLLSFIKALETRIENLEARSNATSLSTQQLQTPSKSSAAYAPKEKEGLVAFTTTKVFPVTNIASDLSESSDEVTSSLQRDNFGTRLWSSPLWRSHPSRDFCDILEGEGAGSMAQSPSAAQDDLTGQYCQGGKTFGSSERVYLSLYFQMIQPQWPLLNQSQCQAWFARLETHGRCEFGYQTPIIFMICAVGALFCSSFARNCPHLAGSIFLSQQSIADQADRSSPRSIARLLIQLLRVIYLLHQPDSETINDGFTTTAKDCRELLKDVGWRLLNISDENTVSLQSEAGEDFNKDTLDAIITTAFTINEVVCSVWSIPGSGEDGRLDQTLWDQCARLMARRPLNPTASEHLLEVRCLQSEIRRFNRNTAHLAHGDARRATWRNNLKDRLDNWRGKISSVSDDTDASLNHHTQTMKKMYDYCLCNLFQEELLTLDGFRLDCVLRAASEACFSFRKIQENEAMIYFTCSAFRMGMILLCCFWITDYYDRTPVYLSPETLEAIESCFDTLSRFTARWPSAALWRDTFEIIASATPLIRLPGQKTPVFPAQLAPRLTQLREQLKKRHTADVSWFQVISNGPVSEPSQKSPQTPTLSETPWADVA
ncbi:hypothetical protein N7499_003453 [Penicillium canescens]|nr:hypothetical protein N7444_001895 [Penicillium canescens]KAJ6090739.1 hypothetical protein N7499_003453 [Penicillium canescens]